MRKAAFYRGFSDKDFYENFYYRKCSDDGAEDSETNLAKLSYYNGHETA